MNVASLELCKELYELSGKTWKDTIARWYVDGGNFVTTDKLNGLWLPAYDSGYLLRKLPTDTNHRWYIQKWGDDKTKSSYAATYQELTSSSLDEQLIFEADTPEDAAVKLAIELFKQGVLTKEEGL